MRRRSLNSLSLRHFFAPALCLLFVFFFAGWGFGQKEFCCEFSPSTKPLSETVISLPSDLQKCELLAPGAYGAVAFTGSNVIVAGFHVVTCQRAGKMSAADRHTQDIVVQIDASTGKELKRIEWKDLYDEDNMAGDIDVVATYAGRFLVRVGPFVKLISSDFKEVNSRRFVTEQFGPGDHWIVRVAPSGKIGLFRRWNRDDVSQNRWFSTDTLDDELVEKTSTGEGWHIVPSESSVYFTQLPNRGPNDHLVLVRTRGERESHPLCSDCAGIAEALAINNTIFVATSPKASFSLVTAQGEIIHRESFGDGIDHADHVVASSAALRFAFTFGHLHKNLVSWKSPTTVVVYDINKMKVVLKVKFDEQLQNISGPYGGLPMLGLSPDGRRVAILAGRILKVFSVPE